MAGEADLKINVTADAKQAKGELGSLDGQLDATGGGMGKLGAAAAIGGAALIALGTKSIMAFQDLGLTVGKFSDATGISAEESSRLIEVAGDLGIGTEKLQTGIVKMTQGLGPAGDGLAKYGVEAKKNADGTVNLSETFIGAVGAINGIQDPLKRTEAQTAIFGKGFKGMAELTSMSADQLKSALAGVSDAKIFDEEKVNKAKDLRSGFDAIKDAGEDLFLTIGNALAPVVAKLAEKLGGVLEKVSPLAEAIGTLLVAALELIGPLIDGILALLGPVIEGLSKLADAVSSVASGISDALTVNVDGAVVGMEAFKEKSTAAAAAQAELAEQEQLAAEAAEAQAEAAEAAAKAEEELEAELKETEKALKASKAAQEALSNAYRIGSDVNYALADAQDNYAETVAGLDQKVIEAAGNQTTINKLYREATQDAAAVAQATVDVAVNQAEMNGQTLTATQKLDAMNLSMLNSAATATGPLRASILGYIADTNGIPAEKATAISAAIEAGDIETAERLLTEASRAREVAIKTDTDSNSLAHVERQLDDLAKDRIVKFGVSTGGGMKAFAKGGTTTDDDEILVGEEGPEIARLPRGTQISSAPDTAARRRGAGAAAGTTYVDASTTNHYWPPGVTPKALTAAERQRARRGLERID